MKLGWKQERKFTPTQTGKEKIAQGLKPVSTDAIKQSYYAARDGITGLKWAAEDEEDLHQDESSNPSQYKTPDALSGTDLFNAIRQDLQAELDAISLYEAHKAATDDPELRKILDHIIAEEKDHVMLLSNYLKKHDQWKGKSGEDYSAEEGY